MIHRVLATVLKTATDTTLLAMAVTTVSMVTCVKIDAEIVLVEPATRPQVIVQTAAWMNGMAFHVNKDVRMTIAKHAAS